MNSLAWEVAVHQITSKLVMNWLAWEVAVHQITSTLVMNSLAWEVAVHQITFKESEVGIAAAILLQNLIHLKLIDISDCLCYILPIWNYYYY